MQGEGKSLKSIAKDVGRSPHVIRNFIENRDGYGTHFNRSGRKKKLSARDERQIARAASNSMKSCATIKTELKLDVERTTVWRSIQRNPHLVRQKLMSAPRLEPIHERNRLEFARINMGKDWILVRFLSFFNTVFRSFFLKKKSSISTVLMVLTVIGEIYAKNHVTFQSATLVVDQAWYGLQYPVLVN